MPGVSRLLNLGDVYIHVYQVPPAKHHVDVALILQKEPLLSNINAVLLGKRL